MEETGETIPKRIEKLETTITRLAQQLRDASIPTELKNELSQYADTLEKVSKDVSWKEKKVPVEQIERVSNCASQAKVEADSFVVKVSKLPESTKNAPEAQCLVEKLIDLTLLLTKVSEPPQFKWLGQPEGNKQDQGNTFGSAVIDQQASDDMLMGYLKESTTKQLRVISVTGDKGIGKTAMVRRVYNRRETKHLFRRRAWVSCSDLFPLQKHEMLKRVLVDIIKKSSTKELRDLDKMGIDGLTKLINEFLSGIQYLIVLDDLEYAPPFFPYLVHVLPDQTRGSRVILTSNEVYCQHDILIRLGPLSPSGSCELLENSIEDEGSRDEIIRKCKGSPTKLLLCRGIVAASGAESSSSGKWLDELGADPTLEAVMHLSYQKLPHWIKACLLYLCLFPRGSEMSTRRVFQLWYAEGRARRDDTTTAEACLKVLVNQKLVQVWAQRETDGCPKTFCLASHWWDYLSGLVTGSILGRPSAALPWVARYSHDAESLPRIEPHIRSYVSFNTQKLGRQSGEVERLLKLPGAKADVALLRVLDLEGVYKPRLPKEFGDLLPNLRYLGLRWTILDSLPESVAKLNRLETLDLKHTNIAKLPSSMLASTFLRHLFLNEVSFDDCKPKEICLRNVETLWGLSIGASETLLNAVEKLKMLKKLGLTYYASVIDDTGKLIPNSEKLESLRLRSRDVFGQPSDLKISSKMKSLGQLWKLHLLGKMETKSLSILPDNLRVITLSMSEMEDDPMMPLGLLQHLVILRLFADSYKGETMHCTGSSFPRLQVLKLLKLEKLKELQIEQGGMPSLEEFSMTGCKEMRKICGLKNLPQLKHVKLAQVDQFLAESISRITNIVTARALIRSSPQKASTGDN